MGTLDSELAQSFENFPFLKVHSSAYKVLGKIVDGVISLIPAIESAKPGCTLGIQELCCLNIFAEKAKQLIQQCAKSSKLYLVITAGAFVSRCERIRDAIERSLRHIYSMVPEPLTTQFANFATLPLSYETRRLLHIIFFLEIIIQKDILHVKLKWRPTFY